MKSAPAPRIVVPPDDAELVRRALARDDDDGGQPVAVLEAPDRRVGERRRHLGADHAGLGAGAHREAALAEHRDHPVVGREDFGDEMALRIARRHVMFLMRPGGQSQFSAHLAPEAYPQARLTSLLRWIPENISADLDIAALAARANMSERSFARIFKQETGETPAHYVERMRLDGARRLLAGSTLPVASVASRSGFGSEERMRRVFQRHLKISPSDFRERFRAQGDVQ